MAVLIWQRRSGAKATAKLPAVTVLKPLCGAEPGLYENLRTFCNQDYPELQIVCTTHSPYLLDLFEPSEIRVLALDSERRTHARPLTEHPDFAKWKFGTQTGELWAALGEAWVVDGVPAGAT